MSNDGVVVSKLAAALLCIVCAARAAPCAELFYLDRDANTNAYTGPRGPLVLSGNLEGGDCARLIAKIAADPERYLERNTLVLAVSGGDVEEALKVAELVAALHSTVSVQLLTGRCTSVCFLVYAAAAQRATDAPGLLGLSRPEQADDSSAALRDTLRRTLAADEVPDRLVQEMFGHGDEAPYWLTPADEELLRPRSRAFVHFLFARCAWDDALERQALGGARPFADLDALWECRRREVAREVRRVLATAVKQREP